jgi:chromosome segregation ATPase
VATSDADYCAEYATTCGKLRELHSAKRRIAEMEKELSLLRPIGESIDRISKSLEDGTNASEPLVDFCSGCERVAELEAERDALQARVKELEQDCCKKALEEITERVELDSSGGKGGV